MSRDISGDSIANLLFVSYYSSDDGSSKLYLFHSYSKLHLEDLAPDGIAPLHPSPPLPWFTLPIKSSSLFLSNTQHSIPAYWNSSGSTSSSQCMYYQSEEGDEGGSLCGGFWQTYFWKISPVFWKPVTLWQSHWYAKSYLGSDMWNFFSFCKASWVPATVWKCIQRTSALQNYCMLLFPACTGIWGNLCGWSNASEVKHSHRAWLVNWVYPSAIFSLRLWPCTHTHTHTHMYADTSMGALHLWHHTASFKCLSAPQNLEKTVSPHLQYCT